MIRPGFFSVFIRTLTVVFIASAIMHLSCAGIQAQTPAADQKSNNTCSLNLAFAMGKPIETLSKDMINDPTLVPDDTLENFQLVEILIPIGDMTAEKIHELLAEENAKNIKAEEDKNPEDVKTVSDIPGKWDPNGILVLSEAKRIRIFMHIRMGVLHLESTEPLPSYAALNVKYEIPGHKISGLPCNIKNPVEFSFYTFSGNSALGKPLFSKKVKLDMSSLGNKALLLNSLKYEDSPISIPMDSSAQLDYAIEEYCAMPESLSPLCSKYVIRRIVRKMDNLSVMSNGNNGRVNISEGYTVADSDSPEVLQRIVIGGLAASGNTIYFLYPGAMNWRLVGVDLDKAGDNGMGGTTYHNITREDISDSQPDMGFIGQGLVGNKYLPVALRNGSDKSWIALVDITSPASEARVFDMPFFAHNFLAADGNMLALSDTSNKMHFFRLAGDKLEKAGEQDAGSRIVNIIAGGGHFFVSTSNSGLYMFNTSTSGSMKPAAQYTPGSNFGIGAMTVSGDRLFINQADLKLASSEPLIKILKIDAGSLSEIGSMTLPRNYFVGSMLAQGQNLTATFLKRFPDKMYVRDLEYNLAIFKIDDTKIEKQDDYFNPYIVKYSNIVSARGGHAMLVLDENNKAYLLVLK